MLKLRFSSFLLASALGLSACGGDSPTISNDAPINRTAVIFSPSTAELPVPSDLQFSSEPARDGTMNAGTDPENPVITGIDALDGNSVLAPFDIAFDAPLNTAQALSAANFISAGSSIIPNSGQNVFLLPLTYPSGDGLLQASIEGLSVEVPTFAEALSYQTAVATADVATLSALAQPTARAEIISLDGGTNNILRITPLKPLQPKTKYLVILTDIEDSNGVNTVASEAYDFLKGEDTDTTEFASDALLGLRSAIQNWETLAAGYFNFVQSVFDAAGVAATAPSPSDIIFSMTFTTGGTTDVLTYIAAPETFFDDSLRAGYKKDAIVKLVSGEYSLSTDETPTDTDGFIEATIIQYLTTDSPSNPLYNVTIAEAIAQGASYSTIATDATAAYIMQRAAAEAAIAVNDEGGAISATAAGAVLAMIGESPASNVFPVPAPRTTNFFRRDIASDLNSSLVAPAIIYQGEITLPYYQTEPTDQREEDITQDFTPVKTSSWQADTTIGGLTPPSNMITYRFPFPEKKSDVTIPILVTTPDETTLGAWGYTKPDEGWPVIIYVHGITTERSTSLPMANALAFACIARDESGAPTGLSGAPCFATIAIDQPLHGIAPASGPGGQEGSIVPGLYSVLDAENAVTTNIGSGPAADASGEHAAIRERHFDLTADAATNPIPMDYTDGMKSGISGSLFINLTSFTTSRDNLRQMTVDLLNLNASLDSIDLDSDGTPNDLDPDNVYFIGHSLGAINGLPFVAINNSAEVQNGAFTSQPNVKAAVGLVTGGGIAELLANSPSFAPRVLGGLAAASDALTQGNSGLESYYSVLQGVLDSVDVMNFASSLSDENSSTGILLTEVVGDGTEENLADQTIPNAADSSLGTPPLNTTVPETGFVINGFPAPLAGTEPLITQFGAIATVTADDSDGDAAVIVTRFTQGTHGTPASADNLAVFSEIVSETVSFFAVDGRVTGSIVSNTTVVEE